MSSLLTTPPDIVPALDPEFRPSWNAMRDFRRETAAHGEAIAFALERAADAVSVFTTRVLPASHAQAGDNLGFAERLLKLLLWQRGARRVRISGPQEVTRHLLDVYRKGGERSFDVDFFTRVYGSFELESVRAGELPAERESPRRLGGHHDGCRIGFDAGGSDRKVAALIDGELVFSEEVVWQPKLEADPAYHFAGIDASIQSAARRLPRIDAIGVSSAGVYVDNRTRVASLFRKVPEPAFSAQIAPIYLDVAKKWGGVPIEVANDGDVAALAGALELNDGPVLGLSLGTSLAAGYVDAQGRLQGFLNELAFAPLDYAQSAPVDQEWSGDRGTCVHYLSQDGAVRLAQRAGLELVGANAAEQLRKLQAYAASGEPRARAVYESLGAYLGYALLTFAEVYALKHVLLLGRVTSGNGGRVLLENAKKVLAHESPELAGRLTLHLPDESTRRVGQAVAAASLPLLTVSPAHGGRGNS
jgi:predicted NBD/HSP70 family sugar kinase